MGAQLVALPRIQRAFQQGAEDRGLHLSPVVGCGLDQQPKLQGGQGQGRRLAEQAAVEAFQVAGQGWGKAAAVHGGPQAFQHGGGVLGMAAPVLEQLREGAFGDQLHVFGKHREQGAHQEACHGLGGMALGLEGPTQLGQVGCHLAGDLGADAGRIEAVRIVPDGLQAGAGRLVAQVVQRDAVAVAVRKLRIALPLAREVGINLDHVAHVHDQQERRPAILARNGAGIAVGLVAGAQHGVVPAARPAQAVPLALHHGRPGQQVKLAFIRRGARALLGLHDKATAPVKVDEAARLRAGVDKGHGPLETVVVVLGIGGGGLGGRNLQKLRQLMANCWKSARSAPPDADQRAMKSSMVKIDPAFWQAVDRICTPCPRADCPMLRRHGAPPALDCPGQPGFPPAAHRRREWNNGGLGTGGSAPSALAQ